MTSQLRQVGGWGAIPRMWPKSVARPHAIASYAKHKSEHKNKQCQVCAQAQILFSEVRLVGLEVGRVLVECQFLSLGIVGCHRLIIQVATEKPDRISSSFATTRWIAWRGRVIVILLVMVCKLFERFPSTQIKNLDPDVRTSQSHLRVRRR